jgi:hypothetical protein
MVAQIGHTLQVLHFQVVVGLWNISKRAKDELRFVACTQANDSAVERSNAQKQVEKPTTAVICCRVSEEGSNAWKNVVQVVHNQVEFGFSEGDGRKGRRARVSVARMTYACRVWAVQIEMASFVVAELLDCDAAISTVGRRDEL